MNDDLPLPLLLILLVIGAVVTMLIFGDWRCLLVDCVITKP